MFVAKGAQHVLRGGDLNPAYGDNMIDSLRIKCIE